MTMECFSGYDEKTYIIIPRKEYAELQDAKQKLQCLEAGGVDNWEWYGESLQDCGFFDEDEESEEDIYGDDV
jgi:hypothetical protein